jgi:hypothetical protein
MNVKYLKDQVNKRVSGHQVDHSTKPYVDKFMNYIDAYCAELKYTDVEILRDDDHFERVFEIYSSINKN